MGLCAASLVATARMDERENINFFGGEYVEYMMHSKMFIPFVFWEPISLEQNLWR